jgi:hypothetical protein
MIRRGVIVRLLAPRPANAKAVTRSLGDAREPQQVRHAEVLAQGRRPGWILSEIERGVAFKQADEDLGHDAPAHGAERLAFPILQEPSSLLAPSRNFSNLHAKRGGRIIQTAYFLVPEIISRLRSESSE